jgi:hypothetical protein
VTKGYYYYKQLARAGAPGTHVAHTAALSTEVSLLAFAGGRSPHPDAVAVINVGAEGRRVAVRVRGTGARAFGAFRTTGGEAHEPARTTARRGPPPGENYRDLGVLPVRGGVVEVDAPANSVTTLFAER